MSTPAEYFQKNGYALLTEVLDKKTCNQLCEHMFKLHHEGKLVKDDQCPLSDSVYGDPVFDQLLAKLAEPIGHHIGVDLLPTYTYCRIYRPGEILKRHTDRPSCEISGTMTLGYSPATGSVWPIYVSDDPADEYGRRVDIETGNLLMYAGNQLVHWRPEFKGEWQVQVFFHYVRAEGAYADHVFDHRPQLGMDAHSKVDHRTAAASDIDSDHTGDNAEKPPVRNGKFPIFGGVMIPSWDLTAPGPFSFNKSFEPQLTFTAQECETIIAFSNNQYAEHASVGSGERGRVDKNIRDVNQYKIPLNDHTRWIFDRLSRAVSIANAEHYDFEIMGITHELQLLHYDAERGAGHYNWHTDIGPGESATRKISVSVQLSDETAYQGGDLVINNNGEIVTMTKQQGSVAMFPSYQLHKVEPITSGSRWALVIWVHGSHKFR